MYIIVYIYIYLEVQGAFTNPVLENYLPDSTHHILLDSSKNSTLGSQQKEIKKRSRIFLDLSG